MARRLILLSDGTGNSAAKLAKTNVWRTYQALDLSGADQVGIYDDGVGNSSVKVLALLGGAFGWGLKRNVLHLYKFLCRNYRDGDRVFGFGFSRGAFTIRMVVGLVLSQGLVRWNSEEELEVLARSAYREYREKRFVRGKRSLTFYGRVFLRAVVAVWNKAAGRKPYDSSRNRQVPTIAFLGLWDTVDAYGVPIKELKTGIDRYIWPLNFDDAKLDARVERAFHALALDDERETFHPLVWDESDEPKGVDPRRVNQKWFPGMHSNVGGGYPDDGLAHVSLLWMLEQAAAEGLQLKPAVLDEYRRVATPYGKMYDSRSGLSAYYRYAPRKVDSYRTSAEIHESAFLRMANGNDLYAPISIPAPEASEREYEIAWDTVWWRTIAYWIMVILTVVLLSLGWWSLPWPSIDAAAILVVGPLVEAIKTVLPKMVAGALDNLALSPTTVLVLLVAIAGTYRWGTFLQGRVRDRASVIWRLTPSDHRWQWFKQSRERWHVGTIIVVVVMAAVLAWSVWSSEAWWIAMAALGVLASVALFVVRRKDDAQREKRLRDGEVLETRGWGLNFARAIRRSAGIQRADWFIANRAIPFVFAMAVILAMAFAANRASFEILSVGGLTCQPSANRSALAVDAKREVSFSTSEPCHATGIWLEHGARYEIEFVRADSWRDAGIPVAGTAGFTSTSAGAPWYLFAFAPMKRDVGLDWFRAMGRIGDRLHTTVALDGRTQVTVNGRSDELFLFVNDAVIGLPWVWDYFYRNNSGEASVVIRRVG